MTGRGAGPAPTVSVLLPVRNAESTLPEAIASLEAQRFDDFEVLAVDDGSTDDSGVLLEAWAARDPRVRLARRAPAGIVAALEHARTRATAPYLARMDADDVAHPHRLEKQLALMRARPELAGCGCLVEYFPRSAVRAGGRRYERWINAAVSSAEIERAMFVECPLAHPTFLLSTEAVDAAGGYRDVGWPEDYDLVLRMWRGGAAFAKVPEVLLRWREGPARLSRVDPRYGAEAFLACKVHHLRRSLLPDGRAAVIWGAGPVGKAVSRALRAAGSPVEAFVELDTRKIGQVIHGAPVLDTSAGLRRRRPLHLAAVGQRGARARIVALLEEARLRPMDDFVAVA